MDGLYTEGRNAGNKYRQQQLDQVLELIEKKRKIADDNRSNYLKPDYSSAAAYSKSIEVYRRQFENMLGWPLCDYDASMGIPDAKMEFVAEDDISYIYRLNIDSFPGLTTYGILFLPKAEPPYPLVISQHGGGGTPELCSDFFGSANYNDMSRRVLRKGIAVFAPQLLLWNEEFGPGYDRNQIDNKLKQLGGSVAALDIFKIRRSLDYLTARPDIDAESVGMIGLSYGGFYTLFTAAIDTRIKAAVSSCFFNNRFVYDWFDWTWFNAGNTFLDAEVCALICPRSLYIEVAKNDEAFSIRYTKEEYKRIEKYYEKLGLSKHLQYKEFEGVHELDRDDDGINFLFQELTGK